MLDPLTKSPRMLRAPFSPGPPPYRLTDERDGVAAFEHGSDDGRHDEVARLEGLADVPA
jgi:hypothetical protein